jgi:hypothetical protein
MLSDYIVLTDDCIVLGDHKIQLFKKKNVPSFLYSMLQTMLFYFLALSKKIKFCYIGIVLLFKHKAFYIRTTTGYYVACLKSSVNGTRKQIKGKIQTN